MTAIARSSPPVTKARTSVVVLASKERRIQRMRTNQTILTLIGGILILGGILYANHVRGTEQSYQALHEDRFEDAERFAAADLANNEGHTQSRLCLLLAALGQGRNAEAEEHWQALMRQPVSKRDGAKLMSGDTVLADWRRREPRKAPSYEGYIEWAQAWLAINRVEEAVQAGEAESVISGYRQDQKASLLSFWAYAARIDSANGDVPSPDGTKPRTNTGVARSFAPAGFFTERFRRLEAKLGGIQASSDLKLALAQFKGKGVWILGEDDAAIAAALDPYLLRARKARPKDHEIRALWLLSAAELVRRDGMLGAKAKAREQLLSELLAEVQDDKGRSTLESLKDSELDSHPTAALRLLFGKAVAGLAVIECARASGAATELPSVASLRLFVAAALKQAAARLSKIADRHPDLVALEKLEKAVVALQQAELEKPLPDTKEAK